MLRRMEHFIEFHDLIPRSQFGFRKGKSVVDCVSVLVLDILNGFSHNQKMVALALDIKCIQFAFAGENIGTAYDQ